jgi:hypothetical protein
VSDELRGLEIEARVLQCDGFSESGSWGSSYVIQVPSGLAREASDFLRAYAAEAAADANASASEFGWPADRQAFDPATWRPLAVIVLAGMASFVLGRQTAIPHEERRASKDALAAAVEAIGRPLLTEPSADRSRHRLTYDKVRRMWQLETDHDLDGDFEVRRRFHAAKAAW